MHSPIDDLDFRAVATQAPVAWSVIDLSGRQLFGNPVYAQLFGYSTEEMATLDVTALTHPDDRALIDEYLDDLIAGRIDRYETDKRYVRKDGSEFIGHLVAALVRDAAGAPHALVGVITDVTSARALAEKVARNEERLSKMLTNISDTVTLVGPDGSIQASTGRHTEILGYPTAFWQDRSIFDLVHPDDQSRADAMAGEVLTTPGSELVAEFRIRHHLGHYEDVEIAAVNLLEDPAVGSVVLTTRNITDRKADERALRRMRDRALALAEQRAGFVASVSHELRTPLHAVLGLTELLTEAGLDADKEALVEGIRAEAARLRETVDELLDYAKVEAEGITLEPLAVDLRHIVDGVVRRAAAMEVARGLEVTAQIDASVPPVVVADRHRLDQVLTNLVGNAVKFTEEGCVRIEVDVVDEQLRMRVIDTGPGIPPGHRSSIFEPFAQVPGTASSVGGTGLGLALVRGLIDLMRGEVMIEDADPVGAVFTVTLPLHVSTDEAVLDDAPTEAATAIGSSVLVVEDNPVNQMLVQRQLERLGHVATIASTGGEALEILGDPDHGHDLVLMDWPPDLDGLEVTRRLRAIEQDQNRHVPVIAATASAMPEDRAACRDAGMDDFMPKPVGLADLRVMVDRWGSAPEATATVDVATRFDGGRLDELVEELGDPTLVRSLVRSYLSELAHRESGLIEAARAGQLDVIHRIGHTLRSTSEMVGATELVDLCRLLEAADEHEDLDPVMERFETAAAEARAALAGWTGPNPNHTIDTNGSTS